MNVVIRKSRKKATATSVAGLLAGIAGGLVLYYVGDRLLGWCLVVTAVLTLIYGVGSLLDRKPYIILSESGLTDTTAVREEIGWDAVLHADDFFFRGGYFVRLLLRRDYKPQVILPSRFLRFDRIYESKGMKAVYLRTGGLETDSMQLVALIRRMVAADARQRAEILGGYRLK